MRAIPLQRLGTADDLGKAGVFLASEDSASLGQKIEAEKNGDTVLIRGSPVGRGDYDL